ncbi:uncharacterized protein LOC128848990 isoform X2 [Malaclemys terrapin pileata]|uniref:uncharacterized protein LOC128848990 isoform X2 n=1 Tax=Malaclemys terrapin pileata TaxID=2991368 RepID=UPI0023A8EB1A|nr:uncharacterized protein LOC128848990 isoform X2 [Malaclemys terrapin pileata]
MSKQAQRSGLGRSLEHAILVCGTCLRQFSEIKPFILHKTHRAHSREIQEQSPTHALSREQDASLRNTRSSCNVSCSVGFGGQFPLAWARGTKYLLLTGAECRSRVDKWTLSSGQLRHKDP